MKTDPKNNNKSNADKSKVAQTVWALAAPIAEAKGCRVIETEYVREDGEWRLRVFIDREPPVDHDCCEAVSEALSALLDGRDDFVPDSYFLEVSSPGLERPLRLEADFLRFSGRRAAIRLRAAVEGKREYQGLLRGAEDGKIIIEPEERRKPSGRKVAIPLQDVAGAKLLYDFKNLRS
ncbi:MAG: ribosome maturation factor RimP [Clostridiales bacterium]|nr:ribosome maturation factor RimP [Clostridiales bacterium]